MTERIDRILSARNEALKARSLWRTERVLGSARPDLRVLCSNDYLGVATRRLVQPRAQRGIAGGSGASRLVSGTHPEHVRLESELASWQGRDAALFYATGYQGNVSSLAALIDRNDVVFSDALNHASLIDGIRLSSARRHVYKHADVDSLSRLLAEHGGDGANRWVVTDAVFSMDGDRAPLRRLVELCRRFDACLYVDEAHSVGVYGDEGRGLSDELGVADDVDVLFGACGKAFGASGSFIAGSQELRDYLYNRARGFVFSTAPSPVACNAVADALPLLRDGTLREALWLRIEHLAQLLRQQGWWTGAALSPIFPLVVGDERAALLLGEELLNEGLFVHPIRPPTVPEGTSRLRLVVCAHYELQWLDHLVDTIARVCEREGIKPAVSAHGEEKEEDS